VTEMTGNFVFKNSTLLVSYSSEQEFTTAKPYLVTQVLGFSPSISVSFNSVFTHLIHTVCRYWESLRKAKWAKEKEHTTPISSHYLREKK